jgi:hypothetical protein
MEVNVIANIFEMRMERLSGTLRGGVINFLSRKSLSEYVFSAYALGRNLPQSPLIKLEA